MKKYFVAILVFLFLAGSINQVKAYRHYQDVSHHEWRTPDFFGYGCNSKTTARNSGLKWMKAWVKVGQRRHVNTKWFPQVGDTVQTWLVAGPGQSCTTGSESKR